MSLVPRSVTTKAASSVVRYNSLADTKPKNTPAELLAKPSDQELHETTTNTQQALDLVLADRLGRSSLAVPVNQQSGPSFVKYKADPNAPGYDPKTANRIVRLTTVQADPLEPSVFRHKRLPAAPGDAPTTILRAPAPKASKEELEMWRIPPAISNWKNPRGFVIPLEQRVGADGRHVQDHSVSERFASLAEELHAAEQKAREEISRRNELAKKQLAEEEEERERLLRVAAAEARQKNLSEPSDSHSRARREIMRETLREHRMQRAGKLRERDFSESIALGAQVQPALKGEALFDARLFNRSEGEKDEHYEGRLFAERSGGVYKYDSKRVEQTQKDMEQLSGGRRVIFESGPRPWGEQDEEAAERRKRSRRD